MNTEINYDGFTAVPSDYECNDGELAAAVNVIPEDGQLKMIPQPKPVMQLSAENQRAIFIHETSTFKHYISYNTTSSTLFWHNGLSGSGTEIGIFYGVTHCNAIGNTLLVFTENNMYYILWTNNAYENLGDCLPNVEVSFGLVGHPRLFSQSDSSHSKFTVNFAEGIAEDNIRSDFSDANKSSITSQIMAKLNKFIREQTVDKGRFCFPFFVRYALRLFDGSLVCHSAPILMNPSTKPAPLVMWGRVHGKNSYTEAKDCDIMMVASALDYRVSHGGGYYLLDKWKDIIKSIDVFISKPIYTYDQNGQINNIADTDNFQTSFIGKLYHDKFHRGGAANFPTVVTEDCMIGPLSINNTSDFLTHYMEWPYSRIYQLYFTNESGRSYPGETFHLPEFTDGKNTENIKNCSIFYFLHSISLEDAKTTTRKEVPIENDYLQSLVTREVMTDDYLTHDRLAASTSQVYNSRLNLSGVKRKLFSGFSPWTMFAFCDRQLSTYKVSGQTITMSSLFGYDSITATVYVKEGGQTFALSTSSDFLAPWGSGIHYTSESDAQNQVNGQRTKISWGAYLFYPNVNAVKVVINSMFGAVDNSSVYNIASIVIDLQPHDFLNGAYALLDYDSVRIHNYTSDSVPSATTSPYAMLDCGNKVYTSEVNNPFFFPLTGINTVGTGKILGIATAAKALSQGQFGQFPLYAFTTEGVWAMEVSGTGTYSAKQPITRDVCINPESITQIDSAVLFATDRGIMLISGSQTQCISDSINSDTPFDVLSLPQMNKLHSMLGHGVDTCLPVAPFSSFLKKCGMLYDYVHQRIIVYSPEYTYAYVYSLKSQKWGMMYSQIVSDINSYPEAMAVDREGRLVDFSQTNDTTINGLVVTRPLRLDAPNVLKTVNNVIQRGHFRRGHVKTVLYGSRDLFSWHLVWSSKDHFMRGFSGTPYKYYRIGLLLNMEPDESIYGCSVQHEPRHTNQPR